MTEKSLKTFYCLLAADACIGILVNKRTKEQFVPQQTNFKYVLEQTKYQCPVYSTLIIFGTKEVNTWITQLRIE